MSGAATSGPAAEAAVAKDPKLAGIPISEHLALAERLGVLEHQIGLQSRAPSLRTLQFGEEQEAVQVVQGEFDADYAGVAILNPTSRQISFDTSRRGSPDMPLIVPPRSMIVWPVRFRDLTLAVAPAQATGPADTVTVLRLWTPPSQPGVYPYADTQVSQQGTIKSLVAAQPVLQGEAGKLIEVLSVFCRLNANAEAGTRSPQWEIEDDKEFIVYEGWSLKNVVAGEQTRHFWGKDQSNYELEASGAKHFYVPMPKILIPAGWKFTCITQGVKGGDTNSYRVAYRQITG